MKFTVNTTELQRSLSKLAGVLPSRSTMPILENVLLDLSRSVLTMTATDLTLVLTTAIEVQGTEDGKIAVPAKRLMDTVRSLPDTDARFTIDTTVHRVKIATATGEYHLTAESEKEYPQLPPFKADASVTLDGAALRRIIHRTAFAVSADELRPAMMGVLLQSKGNDLRAVATDGHRLVRLTHRLAAQVLTKDVIVPAKALQAVARSFEAGDAVFAVSDTHARFTFERSSLVSRLIEEHYPNYESVIPADNGNILRVQRELMVAAIRRVGLYASASTHQIRFSLGEDTLEVSAQDLDFGGEARETLPCTHSGDRLEIGFNATYLTDMLTHLDSAEVEFRFGSATRAGILMPVAEGDAEDVLMLVMPVRLNT